MVEDNTSNGEVEHQALTPCLVCVGQGVRLGGAERWWQLQGGGRANEGEGKRREDLDTKNGGEVGP